MSTPPTATPPTTSSTVPPPVRITDLADPRFPAGYDEMLAGMAAMAPSCPLEPAPLLEAAAGAAGLDDFGDDRFREPLEVLTRALRTEGGLSPAGTVAVHTQLVQLLVNRLRITDLLRRHPEIREVPITAPIVIAGLPRTGTTHLHNLLAADPALRSLPYWESGEPVPAPGDEAGPGEPDPRRQRTEASLAILNGALPHFARMHEMTADHAHEEIQLLALEMSTMFFETLALLPSYRDWYRATDQTPAYQAMRTTLQALTWLRGGRRWVLKTPQHLEQFGPLLAAFPDATVVVTHRDPATVTASMTTMLTYLARLHVARPDPAAYGAYWASRLEDMLSACTRDRDLLPAERSIDVRLDDLMADELGTVERIYGLADQPLDDAARAAMTGYLASHQRDRHGRVLYDLADFGLDESERRAALQPYRQRFGV